MKRIIIDPHNCITEEIDTLKKYLEDNCWDWKEIDESELEDE